jgi:hypothetical protein
MSDLTLAPVDPRTRAWIAVYVSYGLVRRICGARSLTRSKFKGTLLYMLTF